MPYLTMKKLKLELSPGLVAYYDIQSGKGVGLFWDTTHTHTHTYLLTYLLSPDPHGKGIIGVPHSTDPRLAANIP